MAETTTPTTGTDLIRFLDWAREKGEMKANTVNALKAAAKAVLEVAGDGDLNAVDVRTLDLDTAFRRFENLPAGMNLSSGSLRAYRNRVAQAITMFLAWADDRTNWKRSGGRAARPSPNGKAKPKAAAPARRAPSAPQEESPSQTPAPTEARGRLIDFPFPLRDGAVMARLFLPADLKRAEVKRLCAHLSSLAVDAEVEE